MGILNPTITITNTPADEPAVVHDTRRRAQDSNGVWWVQTDPAADMWSRPGLRREDDPAGEGGGGEGEGGGEGGGTDYSRTFAPPTWDFYNQTKNALKPNKLTPLEERGNAFLNTALGISEQWASGILPDDVSKAVRQATSEASVSLGLGTGSAGRNLTVRDLGLSSLDLQERGMKYGLATSAQIESIRQFNNNYELDVQRVLQGARALDLDAYRTQNQLQLSADTLALGQTLSWAQLGLQTSIADNTNSLNIADLIMRTTRDVGPESGDAMRSYLEG